jgi:Alw26I/Eco31I/Esp3I family type II restriction m6 adenine DNA methyltransferase
VTDPVQVPPEVLSLIERFDRNRAAYVSPTYNETQCRQEFINPMFKALGWDLDNTQGYAEPYKDVVHEYSMKIEGASKAPDYSFRIGGTRKFFVEAKKPGVNIKDDPRPAYQLRRYAWSAKLPVSVVTDFAELAIYDCHPKPEKTDRASSSRVLYLTYKDYPERWHEVAAVLSREAILMGSFDSFAEEMKGRRGTVEVDQEFLAEMRGWREDLASHIASWNPTIGQAEVNYAVQQIIDRIVFLRICEDRGIEEYGQLQELLVGSTVYERLCGIFSGADAKYNSGLFHFTQEKGRQEAPDTLTPGLTIDDTVLKKILRRLYYPDSPYEFRVLPADILGQVYEQFLGQVIRLTPSHRAVVEDKPEVKKAGGVYYTPTYIVHHIVEGTLGKLLEGKTVRQAAKLRILDPACGSGTFLIAAYQRLLDWHLDTYIKGGVEANQDKLRQSVSGDWRLTTTERKRILLNSIYGVDIDSQAVEVTKLSLMLKVLEGETEETLQTTFHLLHERALPDMASNIKCGNSLVGTDVQNQMLEEDETINAFDWDSDFKAIMDAGGFDVVIGNPPYDVLEKDRGKSSWPHGVLADYVRERPEYEPALGGKTNLFRFFIVRCLTLTKVGGRYGMIVPLALLADISTARTRAHLMLSGKGLVADCFPQKDKAKRRVFRKAKLSTMVFTCERVGRLPQRMAKIDVRTYPWNSFDDPHREVTIRLKDSALLDPENLPIPMTDEANWAVCHKIHSSKNVGRLKEVAAFSITRGEINQTIYRDFIGSDSTKARLLKGVEVGPYRLNEKLSQGEREWLDEQSFLAHHGPRPVINKRRIATQRITGVDERLRVVATIVDPPMYFADSTNSIALADGVTDYRLEYLLCLLNSTLYQWRFKLTSTNNNVGTNELESMPFRSIDFSDEEDAQRHTDLVALGERMLRLNVHHAAATLPHELTGLERRIEATTREIDEAVYPLFGLSPADVSVIEGEAAREAVSA